MTSELVLTISLAQFTAIRHSPERGARKNESEAERVLRERARVEKVLGMPAGALTTEYKGPVVLRVEPHKSTLDLDSFKRDLTKR
jgi:hypothetical protein